MHQPTSSTRTIVKPGHYCLLKKSLYGARHAGFIWGATLHNQLTNWKYIQSSVEETVHYRKREKSQISLCVIVDNIVFASNSTKLMADLKGDMKLDFDVKLYVPIQSFIRWSIVRPPNFLLICQKVSAEKLLSKSGLYGCNSVSTFLPVNSALTPRHETEAVLSQDKRYLYRSVVGGLSYLSK